MEDIKKEIQELREKLSHYAKMYYVYDISEISDFEYDAMFRKLQELENKHPEFDDVNSPTKRVGGRVLDKFEKVTHAVQMGSLTDVFSFDELTFKYWRISSCLLTFFCKRLIISPNPINIVPEIIPETINVIGINSFVVSLPTIKVPIKQRAIIAIPIPLSTLAVVFSFILIPSLFLFL